ncbi:MULTISPECIES: phosphonate metabolism transcriptional regulator PhnF [Paracoccaceae]|jgi:GntR family phosphonate transport system transcriptional regulator|uniref:phosphonate metabolism transcriptional regulator PhnF n=1 Tax=Rhodobacterales TaxID=204455 RepID=UPI001B0A3534|nr:phosphonate metabolism transcriptional regulator PhnF [Boseongicola sp. H5]MBO6602058.1 phosphonate metabolism transcriptional regulator PhnF [Roseicyclus sp.]MBO6623507.1 phosphonate metabolism transcriptional regulator PhnF [Roseicyclus sp.]MBO6923828.1 phosphonate metabolism transcriptional regulator PhnF [Roseicyclus sp.]
MGRTALWTSIRDTLTGEIGAGRYAPGDKLPTEAELAARFGVNRHTVRRALAALAEIGTVHARRGAGVFVTHQPTYYPIGKRVRFHQNLIAAGREPRRRSLHRATRAADAREADALGLKPGDPVHVSEGVSFADDQPIAVSRAVFPAERFPDLLTHLARTGSVTAAFRAEGLMDYTRSWTQLTALAASPTQAGHLHLQPGAPILRTVGLSVDPEGRPVEYGRTWFAGDRVTLTLAEGEG